MLNHFFALHSAVDGNNRSFVSSKGQLQLFKTVQQLFPLCEIVLNYKNPTMVRNELDVYVPSETLALEYQGQQHYHWSWIYGTPEEDRKKDMKKREVVLIAWFIRY